MAASGSQDGTIKLWDTTLPDEGFVTENGRLLSTLQGHAAGVWGVALSKDGRLVAGGSFDRTVKLWEVESGRLVTTLEGHTGGVRSVALGGDGRLVVSGSYDGSIKLWNTAPTSESPTGGYPHHGNTLADAAKRSTL